MTQSIFLQGTNKSAQGSISWINKTFESLDISANYNFTSTLDGDTVVKYLDSLFIPAGVTVTTETRCKGLVLFVKGDCTINGTLSMTARGAQAIGDNLAIDYINADFLVNPINLEDYIYKIGAAGGASIPSLYRSSAGSNTGATGNSGVNNACGGGGRGGMMQGSSGSSTAGGGAAGTSYSGGPGGGGATCYGTALAASGVGGANGGAGGRGRAYDNGTYSRGAGGGAGNPGGAGGSDGCTGYSGSVGTGGLLILVVSGILYISETGKITSNGSAGGGYSGCTVAVGGGGSGGGSIMLLYGSGYVNKGTVTVNGGAGGAGHVKGGPGGLGSLLLAKITT